jgi:DinB superfamily
MAQDLEMKAVDGAPLSAEAVRMLEYVRSRAVSLGATGIRERVRAAVHELEGVVSGLSEAEARLRPIADKWTIAEVVDHIAQTQIRAAEELRHLVAGRCPPGPPVYEALRSGAAAWAPWTELVDGLRSANHELIALLDSTSDTTDTRGATVRTILVVSRTLSDGQVVPQTFVVELGWKEYAILQRLHLLDHRTQIKKLRVALAAS